MILYPTETVYGLGVNALQSEELEKLYELKGRDSARSVSWLVRNIEDIKRFAEVGEVAETIIHKFLPGPLTLVLPIREDVQKKYDLEMDTIGFRISSDVKAQELIENFMKEHDAPLTSTSANVSGLPTLSNVPDILKQLGVKKKQIETIIDDGERDGLPSTVIEVKNEKLIIHREGQTSIEAVESAI